MADILQPHVTASVRARLKVIIENGNVTQSAIAAAIGIDQSRISKIIRGSVKEIRGTAARDLVAYVNDRQDLHGLSAIDFESVVTSPGTNAQGGPIAKGPAGAHRPSNGWKHYIRADPARDRTADIYEDIKRFAILANASGANAAWRTFQDSPVGPRAGTHAALTSFSNGGQLRLREPAWPGLAPKVDNTNLCSPAELHKLANRIIQPARFQAFTDENGRARFSVTRNQPSFVPAPFITGVKAQMMLMDEKAQPIVGTAGEDSETKYFHNLYLAFFDEPIDLGSRLLGLLETEYGLSVNLAYQHLQRALVASACLVYSLELRTAVTNICRALNQLFYGERDAAGYRVRSSRSRSVDVPLIMNVIKDELKSCTPNEIEAQKYAEGIFLFFQANRLFRLRYRWGSGDPKTGQLARLEKATGQVARPLERCATAAFGLDPTFFLTRIFGKTVNIPGFNFIFRGGLLPQLNGGSSFAVIGLPGTAKTVFSLQMAADIAARGGLAVYLSMEESALAIADRISTFDINSHAEYDVFCSEDQSFEAAFAKVRENSTQGALLIHRVAAGYDVSIESVVEQLDEAPRERWPERAFVLDSVNDLYFDGKQPDQRTAPISREQVNRLARFFEERRFLGIILVEGDDTNTPLSGVVGTVIKLGFSDNKRQRTIEVLKCRSQYFHHGVHELQIGGNRGISIRPSLSAVRSALQLRPRIQPSTYRAIDLRSFWAPQGKRLGLMQEKSTALVYGPEGSGKTQFVARWLAAPTVAAGPDGLQPVNRRVNAMVVAFRNDVAKYDKLLRLQKDKNDQSFGSNAQIYPRWYYPGDNLSGGQIISEIWNYMRKERRQGRPVSRLVFEGIDELPDALPHAVEDSLFWKSLIELVTTEPVSTLFVARPESHGLDKIRHIHEAVDFVFRPHWNNMDFEAHESRVAPLGHRLSAKVKPEQA